MADFPEKREIIYCFLFLGEYNYKYMESFYYFLEEKQK